ncbi:hypothetical protein RRG08_063092 [Elysia crispata]|uniref:C-type lectin domain-containing protein n=1 Tax=Elysia crispata TaxID=231223 RepID=A0AAE0YM34_9GAST|nr:hypothetical protein RRG08_063092 [Elysia crispata]
MDPDQLFLVSADYASGEVVLTLVPDKLTWDQAYHACDSLLGGTLARIDSHEADQAIRQFSTTTWDSYAWDDSWIGIQWRRTTKNGAKRLLWSDNCQDVDTHRYHNFKPGDEANDGSDFCYKMKSSYEWERKPCSEENSFFCEHRNFPYPGSFSTDTGSGIMVVSKDSALKCSDVCNQLYGCYRVSDLGNSSCIVDLVSDDPTDAVRSLYKPMIITASVLDLTTAQKNAIKDAVTNFPEPLWDSPCEPQVTFPAPSGMVVPHDLAVPTVLTSAEPCTSTFILQTSSCAIIQPSISTEVRTTTVLDTVTLTPEVSTVPTTVRYTHTVTETTQLFSSCSPEVITVSTSNCVGVTPSASTMFHTTTVYGTVTETPLVNIVPTTVVLTDTVTRTLDAISCTPTIVPDMETITKTETVSASSPVCPTKVPVYNLTSKNVDDAVSSIVSELSINERSTSRSRAKYKSAPDDRVSSQTMGLISMGFILMVMLLILAIDAPTMIMALKDKNHHRKHSQNLQQNNHGESSQNLQQKHQGEPSQNRQQNHHREPSQNRQQNHHREPSQNLQQNHHREPSQNRQQNHHREPSQNRQQNHHREPSQNLQQNHHREPSQNLQQNHHREPIQNLQQNHYRQPSENLHHNHYRQPSENLHHNHYRQPSENLHHNHYRQPSENLHHNHYREPSQNLQQNHHREPSQNLQQNHHREPSQIVNRITTENLVKIVNRITTENLVKIFNRITTENLVKIFNRITTANLVIISNRINPDKPVITPTESSQTNQS